MANIRKDNTKIVGFRVDKDLLEKFNQSCLELPIRFKSKDLIESYMKYICNITDDYRTTGRFKLGFVSGRKKETILFDIEDKQRSLHIQKSKHNEEIKVDE